MLPPARTTGRGAPARASSPSSEGAPSPDLAAAVRALADALREPGGVVAACGEGAEGALAAVGATYLAHADPARVRLEPARSLQPRLGERAVAVPADGPLAVRVLEGFRRRCPGAPSDRVAWACASDDPSMPEAVHRYLRLGFAQGARLARMRSHELVAPVCDLARSVSNECERTRQFARFSRMADGTLWGTFRPRADTLPLTAGWFAARMGGERFCLVDPVHRVAVMGEGRWGVVRLDEEGARALAGRDDLASEERYVRAMWRRFYDAVGLPGRGRESRGYDLRTHLMPKRLWDGLCELDPASLDAGDHVPERYRDDAAEEGRGTPEREEAPLPRGLPDESL